MTKNQFEKIKPEILTGNKFSSMPIQEKHFYSYAKDAYNGAKTYFKNQEDFLSIGYPDDHVRTGQIWDDKAQELTNVGFAARKNYTFVQWFRICLALDYLYLNKTQLANYINA